MGAFSCTNAVRADNAAETQIISAIFLSLYQNIYYFTQKEMRFQINSYPMYIISLYQVMSILFVTLLVNRFLYRRTKNPYIAGVINAVIVGVFTITNTCTYLL